MSADEVRKHIKAVPFVPFSIHVADGRKIPVFHRDFVLVSPTGRSVYVFQSDDSHEVLDNMLITGISFETPTAQSAGTTP